MSTVVSYPTLSAYGAEYHAAARTGSVLLTTIEEDSDSDTRTEIGGYVHPTHPTTGNLRPRLYQVKQYEDAKRDLKNLILRFRLGEIAFYRAGYGTWITPEHFFGSVTGALAVGLTSIDEILEGKWKEFRTSNNVIRRVFFPTYKLFVV